MNKLYLVTFWATSYQPGTIEVEASEEWYAIKEAEKAVAEGSRFINWDSPGDYDGFVVNDVVELKEA